MAPSGFASSLRFARTAAQLRPIQIYDRLRRHAFPPRPDLGAPPQLRAVKAAFADPCLRPQSYFPSRQSFRALNIERPIAGADIWNDPAAPKLWLYNLHYFDDLSGEEGKGRRDTQAALMGRWVGENRPGAGNGWEPYPISLRIVNWIKWALAGGVLPPVARHSLGVQARFLAAAPEYHLLANHLWANAKALIFAGLFFDGAEAQGWLDQGAGILVHELDEQILADGGHFELSPMYHAIVTEDVLDLINLARTYGWQGAPPLAPRAVLMLDWLAAMTRPDGKFPLFNDAAYGVAATQGALDDYAQRLMLDRAKAPGDFTWLAASGYARAMRGRYALFADLGELGPTYNPGHGHCDMLSFELCVDGAPIIVNTGTSTYDATATRLAERGTAAHNTVQAGGMEQSDIWGAFRVGRRAHIATRAVGAQGFEASHEGFAPIGVIHHRRFVPSDTCIAIEDRCAGRDVPCTARLHIHPDVDVRRDGDGFRAGPLGITFHGADRIEIEGFEYAPEFNRRIPARVIVAHFRRRLDTMLTP